MNERNVAALTEIVTDFYRHFGPTWLGGNGINTLEEYLASRGVLVPGAMTRRDWATLEGAVMWEYIGLDDLGSAEEANGRAALERIARGE